MIVAGFYSCFPTSSSFDTCGLPTNRTTCANWWNHGNLQLCSYRHRSRNGGNLWFNLSWCCKCYHIICGWLEFWTYLVMKIEVIQMVQQQFFGIVFCRWYWVQISAEISAVLSDVFHGLNWSLQMIGSIVSASRLWSYLSWSSYQFIKHFVNSSFNMMSLNLRINENLIREWATWHDFYGVSHFI
jgi:hypothetical protein